MGFFSRRNSGAGGAGAAAANINAAITALLPSSFWKLDEGSGALADSGSGAIAGTYVGGTRAIKGYRGNRAIEIAADTALATFGDNYRFTGNVPFTALIVHRPTAIPAAAVAKRIFGKENAAATAGWILGVTSTGSAPAGRPFANRLPGGAAVISDQVVTLNEYNLFAISYDGANLSMYHNGVMKTAADAIGIVGSADVIRINGVPGDTAAAGSQGRHQGFAVWSRALTLAELNTIWAAM